MRVTLFCAVAVVLLAVLMANGVVADSVFDCPDATSWGRCFVKYDKDKDDALSMKEFKTAWGHMSWYVRWTLEDVEHYFERCDIDESSGITAWELLGDDCIGYCVKQRKVYGDMCL